MKFQISTELFRSEVVRIVDTGVEVSLTVGEKLILSLIRERISSGYNEVPQGFIAESLNMAARPVNAAFKKFLTVGLLSRESLGHKYSGARFTYKMYDYELIDKHGLIIGGSK